MSGFSHRNRPEGNPSRLLNACGVIALAFVLTVIGWGVWIAIHWK